MKKYTKFTTLHSWVRVKGLIAYRYASLDRVYMRTERVAFRYVSSWDENYFLFTRVVLTGNSEIKLTEIRQKDTAEHCPII